MSELLRCKNCCCSHCEDSKKTLENRFYIIENLLSDLTNGKFYDLRDVCLDSKRAYESHLSTKYAKIIHDDEQKLRQEIKNMVIHDCKKEQAKLGGK